MELGDVTVSISTDGVNWIPITGRLATLDYPLELSKFTLPPIPEYPTTLETTFTFYQSRRTYQRMMHLLGHSHGMRREKRRARKRRMR